MPAWPGGLCPECETDMPANLIHCQACRALLNTDLRPNFAEIPEFVPLKELTPEEQKRLDQSPAQVANRGVMIACPACQQVLKINNRYHGQAVQCNFCDHDFNFDLKAEPIEWLGVYTDCPHCQNKLRIGSNFINMEVSCNFCQGPLIVNLAIDRLQANS